LNVAEPGGEVGDPVAVDVAGPERAHRRDDSWEVGPGQKIGTAVAIEVGHQDVASVVRLRDGVGPR